MSIKVTKAFNNPIKIYEVESKTDVLWQINCLEYCGMSNELQFFKLKKTKYQLVLQARNEEISWMDNDNWRTFEHLLEDESIPEESKTELLFHLDLFNK